MTSVLTIEKALDELPDWRLQNNTIVAQFTFDDFQQAFDFMKKVAHEAEKQNHHPTWSNRYNVVDITLSTHDEDDQVTDKDIELATAISKIGGKRGAITQTAA